MTINARSHLASRPEWLSSCRIKRAKSQPDDGFTLVELLVVMIIMPLIIGALSLGIIAVFSQQAKIAGRLSGSTDLQITNATYIRDVESAATVTNSPTPQDCGVVTAGITQLLGLTWSGGQTAVSYVEVLGTSGGSVGFTAQLERLYCANGDMTVPTSVQVVSSDVSTTLQQAPTILCIDVTAAGCTSPPYSGTANNVAQIAFALYIPESSTPFVLRASPRQGAGGNLSGSPNFFSPITLSSPTCGTVLTMNNNGYLYINVHGGTGNGFLTVESPCANTPPVATGGSNGGNLCVAAILTNVQPFPNPLFENPSTTQCPGPRTPPWFYFNNFYDPYSTLTPPTPPSSPGTCSLNNSQYSCSPGLYTAQSAKGSPASGNTFSPGTLPNFKNNYSILFSGGNYGFNTGQPVTIPNGSTTTFQYGTYDFMSAQGADALDVAANSGVTVFGDGALFYAPSGNISFNNNNFVKLVPNPLYLGVSIWDGPRPTCPSSPSPYSTLTLSNNVNNNYGGVYIPCGEIQTKQQGALTTTFIVASSASFYENTTINVTTP